MLHRICIASAFAVTTALASEPASEAPATPPPLDPVVGAIIADPLSDKEYIDGDNCIDQRRLDDIEIIDGERILFHGRRGRVWLNQLKSPCIGLAPGRTLQFELRGSRYCNFDTFRPLPSSSYPRRGPQFGSCFLGTFEPISENQAGLIRESTDRYRRAGVRPKEDTKPTEVKAEQSDASS